MGKVCPSTFHGRRRAKHGPFIHRETARLLGELKRKPYTIDRLTGDIYHRWRVNTDREQVALVRSARTTIFGAHVTYLPAAQLGGFDPQDPADHELSVVIALTTRGRVYQ